MRGLYLDYYLATHTFNSDAKKKELLKRIKGRPNDVLVSMMIDPSNPFHERARVVLVFIGKADFFFCHWYAESEQVIIDKLEHEPLKINKQIEITYALRSLIDNSIKFSKSEIKIFIEKINNDLSIIITDDGPGFDDEI